MIDSNREEFEKLSEISEILKNKTIVFVEKTNKYYCYHYSVEFINGAWYAFQEQQKKLDCCREENKAHLEKIDTALGILSNMKQYGVDEAIYILKGNKDEN